MSILDKLIEKEIWEEFLEYKMNKNLLSPTEIEYLKSYIEEKKYLDIGSAIKSGTYEFNMPTKHLINKVDRNKKRTIYTYNEDETMILKLINYLLYKYDDTFYSNCYSFRKSIGVKQAIKTLTSNNDIQNMYCYKLDISDYFNSVPIDKLLPKIKNILLDDTRLYQLLESILTNNNVNFKNEIIIQDKGIIPGAPISSFLANVYLTDIDKYYYEKNIVYARYSDDIIIFSNERNIKPIISKIKEQISEHGLKLNEEKSSLINPNDEWEYLGFSYKTGTVDLSIITKKKIKGKIRRSARKLRRWMLKKDASSERALKAMNRKFNQKFYGYINEKDFTWSKWFFPLLNTTQGLKEIDQYMQQYLRYITTGKHNKKNYEKTPYSFLRECNYRPLVSEYYNFKNRKVNNLIDKA